jgi:hypothetical protein
MDGRFLKRNIRGSHHASSRVMESSFEESKPYVLTELGKEFVHYVMEDVVTHIADGGERVI